MPQTNWELSKRCDESENNIIIPTQFAYSFCQGQQKWKGHVFNDIRQMITDFKLIVNDKHTTHTHLLEHCDLIKYSKINFVQ